MRIYLTVLSVFFSLLTQAQSLNGSIAHLKTKRVLAGITVTNVSTGVTVLSDSLGRFSLNINPEELVEFSGSGLEKQRVRLGKTIPPYAKIFMEDEKLIAPYHDWKFDSLERAKFFSTELNKPQFTTLDYIQHPFSAMSKRNQQVWAFQKEYEWFEKERYVDYFFNKTLVSNLTGLGQDSMEAYLYRYRPNFNELYGMKEYELYGYIIQTVSYYRQGIDPRRTIRRGSN